MMVHTIYSDEAASRNSDQGADMGKILCTNPAQAFDSLIQHQLIGQTVAVMIDLFGKPQSFV
jgi:hypothetical protein